MSFFKDSILSKPNLIIGECECVRLYEILKLNAACNGTSPTQHTHGHGLCALHTIYNWPFLPIDILALIVKVG